MNPGILSCVCVSALRGWFAFEKWDDSTFLMNNDKDLDLIIKHTAKKIREQKFDEAIKPTLGLLFGIFASIVMIFSGTSWGILGLIGVVVSGFCLFFIWNDVIESFK